MADGTDSDIDPADSDQLFLPSLLSVVLFCYGFAGPKDLTTYCDGIVPVSVCQQAEVTYPYIARGQYVKKEPSDELVRFERHGLLTVLICVISPAERDIAIPVGEDAVIADGDPVGIPAEVLKDPLGATEGRFAIDDPLLLIELFPENLKVPGLLDMADTAGKYKSIRREAFFEKVKELTPEQRRHNPDRNEKTLAA